jgi:hypothetical protein
MSTPFGSHNYEKNNVVEAIQEFAELLICQDENISGFTMTQEIMEAVSVGIASAIGKHYEKPNNQ